MHVSEMNHIRSNYFFFDENCSYFLFYPGRARKGPAFLRYFQLSTPFFGARESPSHAFAQYDFLRILNNSIILISFIVIYSDFPYHVRHTKCSQKT